MNTDNRFSNEIILKAIDGDEHAFTWIYENYHQKVYFSAIQFFKNEANAEDIVQEVFIKVYKQIKTLNTPNAFHSWLHTLTYRTCINKSRGKMKPLQLGEKECIENFADKKSFSIEEQLENKRIKEIVVDSLDTMSLPLRTVGELKFLDDFKVEEIAEILDIPRPTVSSRLQAIKKVLRIDLEREGISTKLYTAAIASPLFLYEAYASLEAKYMMNSSTSERILSTVIKGGGASLLIKCLLGAVAALITVSGIIFWDINKEEPLLKTEVLPTDQITEIDSGVKNAEIDAVNFDTQWRNTELLLEVKTSNNNYDRILVNEIETLEILDNGQYVVKLVKDDSIIDEEEMVISNIDRDSPLATSDKDNLYYYFYISDELSGVNENSIQYYKDGILSNDYYYTESSQVLRVENDGETHHEIYISDFAGNILRIEIT